MKNTNFNVRRITVVAIMSAISYALMMIEQSVPFLMPSFIKFDISDLPALIAAFGVGPMGGVAVELIKNLFHLFITTTGGVGEFANFLLGVAFVLPAGIIYKHTKTKKGAIIGSLVGSVAMAIASLPINYYLTYPVYAKFMPLEQILLAYQKINPEANTLLMALMLFNMPFTFIKGIVCSIITFLVYKKISRYIHG